MSMINDVREFHKFFGHTINSKPAWLSVERTDFRLELISEEFDELYVAVECKDMVEVADALADLIYVTIGTAIEMGIPLQKVWDHVHQSNMAKANNTLGHDQHCELQQSPLSAPKRCTCGAVSYTESGKTAKPAGWKAPNIKAILEDESNYT